MGQQTGRGIPGKVIVIRVLTDMPDRALPRNLRGKMTASHVMRNR
jgi:hypothetical protein